MKVISSDGEEFEIDHDIAKQSTLLKDFSDEGADGPMPLPNVKGSILRSIIEFCNHHKNDPEPEPVNDSDDDDPNEDIYQPKRADDISEWDHTFMRRCTVAEDTIFDIIMAANYLGIKTLLSVGCKTIANMTRGKSSSEVREMLNTSHASPGQDVNNLTTSNDANELNKQQ